MELVGLNMNRLKYIYLSVPLFVLLSCGSLLTGILGTGWILAAAITPLILITWGVVWMRLYSTGGVRPEFAILTVLPHSVYYLVKASGSRILHEAAWQNAYALVWIAFAVVYIMSLRPRHKEDTPRPIAKDQIFLMMCILTIIYSGYTFLSFAAELFNS